MFNVTGLCFLTQLRASACTVDRAGNEAQPASQLVETTSGILAFISPVPFTAD